MDKWFNHFDFINRIEEYHLKSKVLIPVYSEIESVLEKESFILLPIKAKFVRNCLSVPDCDEEIRNSDMQFSRESPRGRDFMVRISTMMSSKGYQIITGKQHKKILR